MQQNQKLDNFKIPQAFLQREWKICVLTPKGGVETLVEALDKYVPLIQGKYSNCMYIRSRGSTRFKALEGAHAGAEETIQETDSVEIIFTLPTNKETLEEALKTIFTYHVNEEPTIYISEIWGSRSNYLDDKDNLNRYWNRSDAQEIHGVSKNNIATIDD